MLEKIKLPISYTTYYQHFVNDNGITILKLFTNDKKTLEEILSCVDGSVSENYELSDDGIYIGCFSSLSMSINCSTNLNNKLTLDLPSILSGTIVS